MKPRPTWSGLLKISLVTIPIKVYTALNESEKIAFNQLHRGCHQRLRQQLVCPVHGKVERDQVVKGYEIEKDRFVVLEPADLQALKLETTHAIEIVQFISPGELDSLLVDTPYYLGPDGPVAGQGFVVLREALRRSRKIGLARIVMAGRERLASVQPLGKGLLLVTLRYPAEVRQAAGYFEDIADAPVDHTELALAQRLIENKTAPFDATAFSDRYQTAVLDTIKAKLNGAQPVQAPAAAVTNVVNLMEALKASLAQTPKTKSGAKSRRPKAAIAA